MTREQMRDVAAVHQELNQSSQHAGQHANQHASQYAVSPAGCCSAGFDDLVDAVEEAIDSETRPIEEVPHAAKTFAKAVLEDSAAMFASNAGEAAVFNEIVSVLCGRPQHLDAGEEAYSETCLQKLLTDVSSDALAAAIAFGPKLTSRISQYIQCQFGLSAQSARSAAQACVAKAAFGLVSGQPWQKVLLDLGACLAMTVIPGVSGNSANETPIDDGSGSHPVPGNPASPAYSTQRRC